VLVGECGAEGDSVDYASFGLLEAGKTRLMADLRTSFVAGDLDLFLEDSEGDVLMQANGAADVEQLQYDLQPEDIGPYFLRVQAASGSSNYCLRLESAEPSF
jgi:hypothetical protein